MLYDPKWDKPKIKPSVFSLHGLIAWLEQQPTDKRYKFTDIDHCLLAQYFRASGYKGVFVGPDRIHYRRFFWPLWRKPLPDHFNDIAIENPSTFGAALDRARAFVTSGKQADG